ncbi:MAG: MBL fold metallo-hydrolase [Clostridia bacterium]|nr:MBL fold metallo-hydrolase [Clostridia bacterium]
MEIQNLYPGGFASNCYLVRKGTDAVLIDATADPETVQRALAKTGATLHAILLTHGHFDHMETAAALRTAFGVPLLLAAPDRDFPADAKKNAHALFFGEDHAYPTPDRTLFDGEVLTFGSITLTVRATPGHTPGSVFYLTEDANAPIAFSGDTVFAEGFGRCDLWGGDSAAMRRTLNALRALPRKTRIYPGHGEGGTLGTALDLLF